MTDPASRSSAEDLPAGCARDGARGERQRIARALDGEPAILVLDGARSALDDDTRRPIMDGLGDLAGRLTIIAVTHRTAMMRPGDRTMRLEAS